MFDNNFGKCEPISKCFQLLIHKKILCIHHRDFHLTCNMLLHYLVKFQSPNMLPNFHIECYNMCVHSYENVP